MIFNKNRDTMSLPVINGRATLLTITKVFFGTLAIMCLMWNYESPVDLHRRLGADEVQVGPGHEPPKRQTQNDKRIAESKRLADENAIRQHNREILEQQQLEYAMAQSLRDYEQMRNQRIAQTARKTAERQARQTQSADAACIAESKKMAQELHAASVDETMIQMEMFREQERLIQAGRLEEQLHKGAWYRKKNRGLAT